MLTKKLLALLSCLLLMSSCGKKDDQTQPADTPKPADTPQTADAPQTDTQPQADNKPADDDPIEGRSFKAIDPEPPIDTSAAEELIKDVKNDVNDLKAIVKSSTEISETEYEALLLKTKECKIDDENIVQECPALTAIMFLTNIEGRQIQNQNEVLQKLVRHSDPMIRGFAYMTLDNVCNSPEIATDIMPFVQKETESFPLEMGLKAFMGCTSTYRGVFDTAKVAATSPDRNIRKGAARALTNTGDVEGSSDIMRKLLSDSDGLVLEVACYNAGTLHDDTLVPDIVNLLKSDKRYQYPCSMALTDMWINYPDHTHVSKAAYDATVEFLSTASFTEDDSAWSIMDRLSLFNTDKFAAWKKQSPWTKDDALAKALVHIAVDEKAGYANRTSAIKAIVKYGSDSVQKDAEKTISKQKSNDSKRLSPLFRLK